VLTNLFIYFIKLYEVRNITRAADMLFVSRQTLSESLKRLEAIVGAQLFVREKDGLSPTASGDLLWEYASTVTNQWAAVQKSIQDINRVSTITFGTDMNYFPDYIIKQFKEFERDTPTISLQFEHYDDHKLIWEAVVNKNLDVGFTTFVDTSDAETRKSIVFREVNNGEIFCLMGRDNRIAAIEEIDFLHDLTNQTVYCGPDLYRRLNAFKQSAGIRLKIQTESLFVIKEKLIRGSNIVLIPKFSIPDLVSGQVVARKCVSMPTRIKGYLIYRADNFGKVKGFADYIQPVLINDFSFRFPGCV
jgi:DNA-binding transcriptional LysR family regulator